MVAVQEGRAPPTGASPPLNQQMKSSCEHCRQKKRLCRGPGYPHPCFTCEARGLPCCYTPRQVQVRAQMHRQFAPVFRLLVDTDAVLLTVRDVSCAPTLARDNEAGSAWCYTHSCRQAYAAVIAPVRVVQGGETRHGHCIH
jgi:Fungal Zn(2)-Cys(6) binuclear cluster domain